MTLSVRAARDSDAAAWDAFVQGLPEATFFHRFGWKRVTEQAFRPPHPFPPGRAGRAASKGVLPLAEIKSRLFGHSLVSTARSASTAASPPPRPRKRAPCWMPACPETWPPNSASATWNTATATRPA
jgi:hypothetical protein